MKKIEKKTGACAHPRCHKVCDEGCYCFGCREFVCEEHATNLSVMGHGHRVALHWSIEDADA